MSLWCSWRYNNYVSPSAQLYYLIKGVLVLRCTNYHDYCSVMANIKILCDVLKHGMIPLFFWDVPPCRWLSGEWRQTLVVWTSRVMVSSEEMFPSRKKSFFVLDIKPHCVWVSEWVSIVIVVELHTFLTSAFYKQQRPPSTQLGMWLDVPQSKCMHLWAVVSLPMSKIRLPVGTLSQLL